LIKDNYIFNPIFQTPDSISVSSGQHADSLNTNQQNNFSDFGFSLERKTLISTESGDTINDTKPLPQILRTHTRIKEIDTLKYERFFFTHINDASKYNSRLIIDLIPSFKPDPKSNENLAKYISEREYSKPKTKNNKVNKEIKAKIIKETANQKSKTLANIKQKEIISIPSEKTKTSTNSNIQIGDWFIGVVLFSAFIFAWVKMFYNRNYKVIINSILNYQLATKYLKENNSTTFRVSVLLNSVFLINISIFILQNIKFWNIKIDLANWKLYIAIILTVSLIYIGKYLVFNTLGFVFKSKNESKEYISNVWLYNKILGIFIFPIIISTPYIPVEYRPTLMFIGIALVLLSFSFRIIRSFQIAMKIKLSIFYLILYLCTLEVLPILIIVKITSYI
jgi:hypothetical protein